MGFLVALRFLTVLPVPFSDRVTPESLGRSLAYFPLVGFLLGLGLVGSGWLLGQLLVRTVVDALLIALLVAATGALHLDGFIDACDGLFAPGPPERRLEIMRDSRVGAYGVAGGSCLILLKYVALVSVPLQWRDVALILGPVLGAWAMVYSVYAHPYARPAGGLGQLFKEQASGATMGVATALTAFMVLGLWELRGLVLWLGVCLALLGMGRLVRARLPGYTGDLYGASNEGVQLLVWLLVPPAAGLVA